MECDHRPVEADASANPRETRGSANAASVTIVILGYRARCTTSACRNLGRLILRYADAGGGPMSNGELRHAHARERIEGHAPRGSRFMTIARSVLHPAIR